MIVYPPNTPTVAPPAPVAVGGVLIGIDIDEVPIAFTGATARTYTRVRISTAGTLTAHDVNCIQLIFQPRNPDGTAFGSTVTITTQTTGGGGTGNWAAYQTITATVSLPTPAGGSVSLAGDNSGGTGALVPDFVIGLE